MFADPRARFDRSRLVALLLALALVALVFFTLIEMGLVDLDRGTSGARLVSIRIGNAPAAKQHATKAPTAPTHTASAPVARAAPPPPRPLQSPVPAFIHMSHDELAGADISKLPKGGGSAQGAPSTGSYGPGEGPGGMNLVNADWVRHPSDAELRPYFPEGVPPHAWATIACKMMEHYHVENCQELDESPPGSGLARGLRRAAWQFLVRPSQVNGRDQIGKWVRIRFTWTEVPRSDDAEPPPRPETEER